MPKVLDDAAALLASAALAQDVQNIHEILSRALTAIRPVIPYDLAVLYELSGDELRATNAEGPLANERVQAHRLDLGRFPTIQRALETRRPIALEEHDHDGAEGDPYDGVLDLPSGHSCMIVPLAAGSQRLGAITLDRTECETYSADAVELADVFGRLVSTAILFARQAEVLAGFRDQLEEHTRLLMEDKGGASEACQRLAASRSPGMQRLAETAKQVARTDVPVLLRGETGTGKEVLAEAIHHWSARSDKPFVKVNCAALPANLIESELFGHVRGAFSGADKDRPGRFRTANGGTLLLDEIGDMPLELQSKLLRVLQEGTFEPVGSDVSVRVDVRVIAATHVDLEGAAQEGRFRQDLFYRIATFPLDVPPLRERLEDIEEIANQFLARQPRGRGPWTLGERALAALRGHAWPGNVRELINVLERATIVVSRGELLPEHLSLGAPRQGVGPSVSQPGVAGAPPRPLLPWREMERAHLEAALARTDGKIYGDDGAATLLGLKPSTLQGKLKKHDLR